MEKHFSRKTDGTVTSTISDCKNLLSTGTKKRVIDRTFVRKVKTSYPDEGGVSKNTLFRNG